MDNKRSVGKTLYVSFKENRALLRLARLSAILAFSFVFSAVSVVGTYPIGIAIVASLSGLYEVSFGFIGAMLGTLLMDGACALSYILAYILLLAARFLISVIFIDSRERINGNKHGERRARSVVALIGNMGSSLVKSSAELFTEDMNIRCMLAAASSLTASLIYMLFTKAAAYSYLFSVMMSAALAPVLAYYLSYTDGKAAYPREKLQKGYATLALIAFLALRSVTVFGIKFSVIASIAVSMYVAAKCGVGYGIALGLLAGLCGTPSYTAAYPIAGAICGFVARKNNPIAAIIGGLGAGIWALYSVGLSSLQYFVPELVAGCAVTAILLKLDILPVEKLLGVSGGMSEGRTHDQLIASEREAKLKKDILNLTNMASDCSELFSKLSNGLSKPSVSELRRVCDECCDRFCSSCARRSICWERDYSVAVSMINKMTAELHYSRRVGADAIPDTIAARCDKASKMLDEINDKAGRLAYDELNGDKLEVFAANYAMSARILDTVRAKRAEEFACDEALSEKIAREAQKRGFFARNISVCGGRIKHIFADGVDLSRVRLGSEDIREIFETLLGVKLTSPEFDLSGDNVKMRSCSAPFVAVACGESSSPIGKSKVCGDCTASFTTDDGLYYSLICDGMGSGNEAALVSNVSAVYLEHMLGSGCRLEESLEALNDFIRAMKLECSVTIDLMEIDLYSGRARFIKSGAAPSFIMRDGKIFKLQSKTVPIGIMRALDAEVISFDMLGGDTVVMLSDGVAESFEDAAWLLDMMCEERIWKYSPDSISRKICERAEVCAGREDDISAIVIKLKEAI